MPRYVRMLHRTSTGRTHLSRKTCMCNRSRSNWLEKHWKIPSAYCWIEVLSAMPCSCCWASQCRCARTVPRLPQTARQEAMRLRNCLNFIRKYFYHCEVSFGFFESVLGIFSFLSFGNSPLFPARCERKSTQKQFSNNPEIKFKQLLRMHVSWCLLFIDASKNRHKIAQMPLSFNKIRR